MSFLVGKILVNVRILWDPFLIRVFFIRVNREVQDISLCIYSWGPSKNHVGTIKRPFTTVNFFPSAFHYIKVV